MQGTVNPRALCRTARQRGYTTVALTDTNNLYGLWPFLTACREEGPHPIIGAEVRTGQHRLFCLVQDLTGYRNLCRLLTALHCDPDFSLPAALQSWHTGTTSWLLIKNCSTFAARSAPMPPQPWSVNPTSQHNSALRHAARRLDPDCGGAGQFLSLPGRRNPGCSAPSTATARSPVVATEFATDTSLPAPAEWRRFQVWSECLPQPPRSPRSASSAPRTPG